MICAVSADAGYYSAQAELQALGAFIAPEKDPPRQASPSLAAYPAICLPEIGSEINDALRMQWTSSAGLPAVPAAGSGKGVVADRSHNLKLFRFGGNGSHPRMTEGIIQPEGRLDQINSPDCQAPPAQPPGC